ncbi:hypothetical protein KEJ20_07060 [Candidatus Bathyarchaeota archaeon]|nr:hypothetical protein [Candidatus Bathyarchaeota archaeon]
MEFTFDFLVSIKRKGLRNGNWIKLRLMDKALFNCALALAKLRGKISNMDLMVKLASIILRLKETVKTSIVKLGLAKAQALKKLYSFKGVFNWCPSLKEWLKEPNYIIYLGLKEVFK